MLINTSLKNLSAPWERVRFSALRPLLAALKQGDRVEREMKLLELLSNFPERRITVRDNWIAIAKERPVTTQTALRQLTAATRFKCITPFSTPTLLLTSKRDRLVNFNCSKKIAHRLGGQLRIHDQGGHELTLDAPDWIIEKIAVAFPDHCPMKSSAL